MRKLFRISALVASALGAIALTAQAQSVKSFGIIGGVTFASFTGSLADGFFIADASGEVDFYNKHSTTGFVGGFFVDIPVGPSVSLEPELLYASKGAEYTVDLYDDIGDYLGSGILTGNLDYIMIPVLLRYDFQKAGGPYSLIGPAVSFNISCSLVGDGGSLNCSDDLGLETTTTFGGILGLGFQKGSFGGEVRYDFDFGDAFSNLSGLKNAAWEVLLRYQFK
jgi:hypothetical protein